MFIINPIDLDTLDSQLLAALEYKDWLLSYQARGNVHPLFSQQLYKIICRIMELT